MRIVCLVNCYLACSVIKKWIIKLIRVSGWSTAITARDHIKWGTRRFAFKLDGISWNRIASERCSSGLKLLLIFSRPFSSLNYLERQHRDNRNDGKSVACRGSDATDARGTGSENAFNFDGSGDVPCASFLYYFLASSKETLCRLIMISNCCNLSKD